MSASIKARVHAPTAPLWQRAATYAVGSAFIVAGLVALNSFPIADTLLGIGAWILLAAPFFLHRQNAKSAQISVVPGRIEIRSPHFSKRTVTTRELSGALVADDGTRFVLTLAERSAPRAPVSIELGDERSLKEIRKALGIRRDGFGKVTWSLEARALDMFDIACRLIALLALTLAGSAALLHVDISALAHFLSTGYVAVVASILCAITRLVTEEPTITVSKSEITYKKAGVSEVIDKQNLTTVYEGPSVIALPNTLKGTPNAILLNQTQALFESEPVTWTRSGMRREERALLTFHLRNEATKARGEKEDVGDEGATIRQLERGEAKAIDWLARVDALASTQTQVGYRGAQISTDDLWTAVENHETARDVRAAAARILMRVSPEKAQDRIAAALDSIHDDSERAHLRAALDSDPEAAAREIESLDEDETSARSPLLK
jgi:hypothetical protein